MRRGIRRSALRRQALADGSALGMVGRCSSSWTKGRLIACCRPSERSDQPSRHIDPATPSAASAASKPQIRRRSRASSRRSKPRCPSQMPSSENGSENGSATTISGQAAAHQQGDHQQASRDKQAHRVGVQPGRRQPQAERADADHRRAKARQVAHHEGDQRGRAMKIRLTASKPNIGPLRPGTDGACSAFCGFKASSTTPPRHPSRRQQPAIAKPRGRWQAHSSNNAG